MDGREGFFETHLHESGLKENVEWDSPIMLDKPLRSIILRLLPYKPILLVTPIDTQTLSTERLLNHWAFSTIADQYEEEIFTFCFRPMHPMHHLREQQLPESGGELINHLPSN